MYIPIEIKAGCVAFGVCPAEKGTGKTAFQNLVIGRVLEIDSPVSGLPNVNVMGERLIKLEADTPKIVQVILPEWRISEFDFGGIPVRNVWFDQERIEKEDTKILGFNPYYDFI